MKVHAEVIRYEIRNWEYDGKRAEDRKNEMKENVHYMGQTETENRI
jgi:hypothetical protein